MLRRVISLALTSVVLVLAIYAGGFQAPQRAQAAPPPPCPSALGAPGGVLYHVFATLPIGVPAASAVCVQIPGFPVLNSGAVTQAPAGCPSPPPIEDAGGSAAAGWVWADWGVSCVGAGGTVVLQFQGPPGLTLGRVTNAATWNIGITTDATVWPATCPASPPGVGGVPLIAKAVAPLGGPYDGVCMLISPAAGGLHSPVVVVSPPACPTSNTVVGAAVSQIWDDFTVKCANAGDTIIVTFMGPSGLIGPCPGCATWLDGATTGDVTIAAAISGVGGIAEQPDIGSQPTAAAGSGHAAWPYAIGGALALGVIAGATAWHVRRRLSP